MAIISLLFSWVNLCFHNIFISFWNNTFLCTFFGFKIVDCICGPKTDIYISDIRAHYIVSYFVSSYPALNAFHWRIISDISHVIYIRSFLISQFFVVFCLKGLHWFQSEKWHVIQSLKITILLETSLRFLSVVWVTLTVYRYNMDDG